MFIAIQERRRHGVKESGERQYAYDELAPSIISITFISEKCNDMIKPRYENIDVVA